MKIAVISDIHSNLLALNLAINSLKQENIDSIYFLGDYITDGENEQEILNIVQELSDYAILGNREKYMLNYSPDRKDFNNYKPLYTTYNNLNQENLHYIASLPEFYIIKINNFKVLMIHGDKYYNSNISLDIIFDKIIADFDFDICLFGHSHKYLYQEYKNKIFINPGSIGEPTDTPTYKYCLLEITDKVNVVLKEFNTQDTFDLLVNNYKKTSYYKNNYVWANLILYIIRDGYDYCVLFLNQFQDKIKNLELNATDFNRIWDETYQEFRNKYHLDLL